MALEVKTLAVMMPSIVKFDDLTYAVDQKIWLGRFLQYFTGLYCVEKASIIDVGANRGYLSDTMIDALIEIETEVVCFEPHPILYQDLVRKYQNKKNVKILPYIAHDKTETAVAFHYSCQRPSYSHVRFSPGHGEPPTDFQRIFVRAIKIDDIMDQLTHPCIFVKIDAEGHDFSVMQGAQNLIERDRPVILFEFCGQLMCDNYNLTAMDWYKFFESKQYRLISPIGLHQENFILSRFKTHCPDLCDLLAIPIEKFDQIVTGIQGSRENDNNMH